MFEWITQAIGGGQRECAERAYAALCAFEFENFKNEVEPFLMFGVNTAFWNFTDPNKRTLVHMAVMRGHIESLELLKNVPINAQDNRGYTALHYAVMIRQNYEVFEWLVRQSINVTIQSKQGYTAHDILEALWQDECRRLLNHTGVDKKFFKKVFLKKINVLFEKASTSSEVDQFFAENPDMESFVRQNQSLVESLGDMLNKKRCLHHMGCPKKNTVDFATFVEPHFVHFGRPNRDNVYWHEVPKSPGKTKLGFSKTLMPEENDVFLDSSTLGLSKLYEEPPAAAPVSDAKSDTVSSIIMNSRMHSQIGRWHARYSDSSGVTASLRSHTSHAISGSTISLPETLEEADLTRENLSALGLPNASEIQASAIHRFFGDNTPSDDGLSDYSFVSTSANTDEDGLSYQPRAR